MAHISLLSDRDTVGVDANRIPAVSYCPDRVPDNRGMASWTNRLAGLLELQDHIEGFFKGHRLVGLSPYSHKGAFRNSRAHYVEGGGGGIMFIGPNIFSAAMRLDSAS